ncbi:MAG: LuxR family transcriptional regulator [Alphaproteobacteria bacterium]|nr:MAG: LuxR family transcriptional regulator [Alphaproteobacteria bacterium]
MALELGVFLEDLRRAATLDDLTALVARLRDELGTAHATYHCVTGAGRQYGAVTYPPEWVARYLECDYARLDPVVQGALRHFRPIDWRALDWSGRGVRGFLAEARAAGVAAQGLTVPLHGPGGHFALFSVNADASDGAWDDFVDRHHADLVLMAHYLNEKALELDRAEGTPRLPQLSPREADVLRLLGLGLNRSAAAERLGISEHTLRVYLESARRKLGARNTVHAVALGIARGLIGW